MGERLKDLEDAEFFKCLSCRHSLFNRLPGFLFLSHFFKGARKHFHVNGMRDNAHSIGVSENNVTGGDANFADLNGNTEIRHFSARCLVLCV